ncbi:MAG: hypothetical protein AABZ14_00495, partial [Candidatus Margulisiibacteriota bacterium]
MNISPSGNETKFTNIVLFVSGNFSENQILISLYDVSDSSLKGSFSVLTNGSITVDLSTAVALSNTGSKNYLLALSLSSTLNVGANQLLLSINSVIGTDYFTNTVNGYLTGNSQLNLFSIAGLNTSSNVSSSVTITLNQFVPILDLHIRPTLDTATILQVSFDVQSNQSPSLGRFILYSSLGATQSVTAQVGINRISFTTDTAMSTSTSNFTMAFQSNTRMVNETTLSVTITSISVQGTNALQPIYSFSSIPTLSILVVQTPSVSSATADLTLLCVASPLTINYFVPAGSARNIIYYVRLYQSSSSTFTQIIWDRVVMKLSGAANLNHIDFQVFEDPDGSGKLNDLYQYVLTPGIVEDNRITLDLIQRTLSLTTTKNFYIVMNLAPTINSGLEMIHVTLDSIEGRSSIFGVFSTISTTITGDGLAKTFSVSGFKSAYSLATNSVAFNDNTALPLMTLETRPQVENSKRLLLQCNVDSQTTNLGYLTVYAQHDNNLIVSTNIQLGVNTLLLPTADMVAGSSYNYSLTFTPLATLPAGVSLSIALSKISGKSYISDLELISYETLPSRNLLIGGIRMTPTPSTASSVFIGGMEVPILKFEPFTRAALKEHEGRRKLREDVHESKYIPDEDWARIKAVLETRGSQWRFPVYLAYYYGLRRNEA